MVKQILFTLLMILPAGTAMAYTDAEIEACTGVVIDGRGTGVQRAMTAFITDKAGNIIYGRDEFRGDYDFLEKHGMVAYTTDARTGNGRLGTAPLVFRAVKAIGVNTPINNCLVVSDKDAETIRRIGQKTKTLYERQVTFIE